MSTLAFRQGATEMRLSGGPGEPGTFDVAIVGGGPAGLTAATYLRRFHRSCVILDAGNSRARWIPESNNCPGFPSGISGVDLLQRMKAQATGFDAVIEPVCVDAIERLADRFRLRAGEQSWEASCVILATGVADRMPDYPWVEEALSVGALRFCSICDAYEATDQRIGVLGRAADIAAHALFLRSYSEQVFLLPTDAVETEDSRQALAPALAAGVRLLPFGGSLEFDRVRCSYRAADGEVFELDTVYPFLGSITSAEIARAAGVELEDGEIVVDANQMTGVEGLFAIGDVVSGLNQISVAVGQAAKAATCVHNLLPHRCRHAPATPVSVS